MFDELYITYGRSLKPDLMLAQWYHKYGLRVNDERAGLPDDLPRTYIRLKRDLAVPWELQERMICLLPSLRIAQIDAGHNVMLSQPQALAAVLNEIVRST